MVWLDKRFGVECADGKGEVLEFRDMFLTTELPDVLRDPELCRFVESIRFIVTHILVEKERMIVSSLRSVLVKHYRRKNKF